MMSEEKQIEEMANAMCNLGEPNCQECANHWEFVTVPKCDLVERAECLYNAGYRKKSEDIVEVVRCKDCTYYQPYPKPVEDFDGRCTVCRGETDENEFCSRGAKMKGGAE